MAQLNTDLETLKTARDNMKLALEGQGQTVTKDIRTYAQAISNISGGGGSGDVKLFETVEEMQADPSPQEGDLAIVYFSSQARITASTEFQVATFPKTVTLPSAISDFINVNFQAVDTSIMFDCWGTLSGQGFDLTIYSGENNFSIQYSSPDGINYTRTSFTKNGVEVSGDEIDFGTTIKFGNRWRRRRMERRYRLFHNNRKFKF